MGFTSLSSGVGNPGCSGGHDAALSPRWEGVAALRKFVLLDDVAF